MQIIFVGITIMLMLKHSYHERTYDMLSQLSNCRFTDLCRPSLYCLNCQCQKFLFLNAWVLQ